MNYKFRFFIFFLVSLDELESFEEENVAAEAESDAAGDAPIAASPLRSTGCSAGAAHDDEALLSVDDANSDEAASDALCADDNAARVGGAARP